MVEMLTLKKLKEKFDAPKGNCRPPTAKHLRESGEQVLLRKGVGLDAEISVYHSGYVLYRSGRRYCVFHVHECGAYKYGASEGEAKILAADCFDDHEWHFRVMLEGEDIMEINQNNRETSDRFSYSDIGDDWAELTDHAGDVLHKLVSSETLHELLHCLTDKQRHIVYHHAIIGKSKAEIADELGLDSSTVRRMFKLAMERIKRKYDFEENLGLVY